MEDELLKLLTNNKGLEVVISSRGEGVVKIPSIFHEVWILDGLVTIINGFDVDLGVDAMNRLVVVCNDWVEVVFDVYGEFRESFLEFHKDYNYDNN